MDETTKLAIQYNPMINEYLKYLEYLECLKYPAENCKKRLLE